MTRAFKTAAIIVAIIVLAAIAATFWAPKAEAQTNRCLPADTWLTLLADEYGEVPAVSATAGPGNVTFTVNPETGTWSMLVSNGTALCIIAHGKEWQPVEAPPEVVPNTAPEIYKRRNSDGWFTIVTRPA